MIKKIVIFGSTGSIGTSTLKSISKNKNFKVLLITANKNIKKLYLIKPFGFAGISYFT